VYVRLPACDSAGLSPEKYNVKIRQKKTADLVKIVQKGPDTLREDTIALTSLTILRNI